MNTNKPNIVCLCGSTTFFDDFQRINFEETMKGNIVLSVGFYKNGEHNKNGGHVGISSEEKIKLDELHKRKIDLSDEIIIINKNNYIGESTINEIAYAKKMNKCIRYYY